RPSLSPSLPGRERPPPGLRSVLRTLQRSASRHAVGEIPDGGREIRGFVPLHDRAEIVIDEEGRPAGAIRHDQRGLALAAGEGAGIDAAYPEPAPLAGVPLDFEPGGAGVEPGGEHDLPPPAL